MRTHYHLIVQVDEGVLARAMHRLNLAYARHHNGRHGLRGHAQSARYGARRLHDETELIVAFAYLANNPVRAGLCRAPVEWPWSTYGGTVGVRALSSFVDPAELLRTFEGRGFDPRAALRAFVEAP
jgi:putative transposase